MYRLQHTDPASHEEAGLRYNCIVTWWDSIRTRVPETEASVGDSLRDYARTQAKMLKKARSPRRQALRTCLFFGHVAALLLGMMYFLGLRVYALEVDTEVCPTPAGLGTWVPEAHLVGWALPPPSKGGSATAAQCTTSTLVGVTPVVRGTTPLGLIPRPNV